MSYLVYIQQTRDDNPPPPPPGRGGLMQDFRVYCYEGEGTARARNFGLFRFRGGPPSRVDFLMIIGPISNEPLEQRDIDLNNPWGRTNALIRWARFGMAAYCCRNPEIREGRKYGKFVNPR